MKGPRTNGLGSSSLRTGYLRVLGPAVAIGLLLAAVLAYIGGGAGPRDAITYLAAGERLNAGHALYDLGPGDRDLDVLSASGVAPLLYPPLISVIWRPLAALPMGVALAVWWLGTVAAVGTVLIAIIQRCPIAGSGAVVLMLVPLTFTFVVGNVDAFVLAAGVMTWLLHRSGMTRTAAFIVGFLAVVKLWPIVLGIWLITREPRAGTVGLASGLCAGLALSAIGAGIPAHFDYLGVLAERAAAQDGTTNLAEILRELGLDDRAALSAYALGLSLSLVALPWLRRWPAVSFASAVVILAIGTPVVNLATPALLLAALAPLAWPWPSSVRSYQSASEPDPLPSPLP